MGSRAYSNKTRKISAGAGLCLATMLMLAACAGVTPPPETGTSLPAPGMVTPPDTTGQTDESRTLAAHSLVREGYELLVGNQFDGAIRVLEKAVGINPTDGQGYFYLAAAWLDKGNFDLAARFNDLAGMYLRDDKTWSRQVGRQKERIQKDQALSRAE